MLEEDTQCGGWGTASLMMQQLKLMIVDDEGASQNSLTGGSKPFQTVSGRDELTWMASWVRTIANCISTLAKA